MPCTDTHVGSTLVHIFMFSLIITQSLSHFSEALKQTAAQFICTESQDEDDFSNSKDISAVTVLLEI